MFLYVTFCLVLHLIWALPALVRYAHLLLQYLLRKRRLLKREAPLLCLHVVSAEVPQAYLLALLHMGVHEQLVRLNLRL